MNCLWHSLSAMIGGKGLTELIWNWESPNSGWYTIKVGRFESLVGGAVAEDESYILKVKKGQSSGADGYEIDDVPDLASFISLSDGEFQEHTFHRAGDVDWIAFPIDPRNFHMPLRFLILALMEIR